MRVAEISRRCDVGLGDVSSMTDRSTVVLEFGDEEVTPLSLTGEEDLGVPRKFSKDRTIIRTRSDLTCVDPC